SQRRFGGANRGVSFGAAARAGVKLLARDRLRAHETLGTLELHIGQLLSSLSPLELSLRLRDFVLIRPRIDHEEHVTFVHHGALDKADALDESGDPWPNLDGI